MVKQFNLNDDGSIDWEMTEEEMETWDIIRQSLRMTQEEKDAYRENQIEWKREVIDPNKSGLKPTNSSYLNQLRAEVVTHDAITKAKRESL